MSRFSGIDASVLPKRDISTDRQVLIVEDVETLARTYQGFLESVGITVSVATTGTAAIDAATTAPPRVMVLDVNLPDMSGLDVLREIKRRELPTEVVVVTTNGSLNLAIEAMRNGASDFIVKPCAADRLRVTVRNTLERHNLAAKVTSLKEEFGTKSFCGFIGQSLAMQSIYRIIRSAAPSSATLFITGESGTGKEVCAEAIHRLSKRANKPFIAVNCAAIPLELLESELFGHVRGAFTGAHADRVGAAMRADGGTLFLDEIGELPLALQAKLLRFLQEGVVQRIGDDRSQPVDVRIVCATNRNPRADVKAGRFREDLFYRLYVIPIELPPLRNREGDALLLAQHFLELYAATDGKSFDSFEPEAEDAIVRYAWPGNVREVQNVMRKIVVLGEGSKVSCAMVHGALGVAPGDGVRPAADGQLDTSKCQSALPREAVPAEAVIIPLAAVIDKAIDDAIMACSGSIPRAAAALDVSPSTIYRRLQARAG